MSSIIKLAGRRNDTDEVLTEKIATAVRFTKCVNGNLYLIVEG
jgi:hypothetical protein